MFSYIFTKRSDARSHHSDHVPGSLVPTRYIRRLACKDIKISTVERMAVDRIIAREFLYGMFPIHAATRRLDPWQGVTGSGAK